MKDNIYLLGFGTFGNPNGFRQSPFLAGNPSFFKSIKTFDLNTNAIKLSPNDKLYSIRKEVVNGLNTVAYTVYTYAKEQNSDRGGTFIGSSLLFVNEIADENLTISKLNEFHQILVSKNTENDVISVNHSDDFSAVIPQDFDKLNFNLKTFDDLTNFNSTNKFLVVFCETSANSLNTYLREALNLLNNYDAIYFTDSQEIAKFVNEKSVYKLIQNVGNQRDFEDELHQYKLEKDEKIRKQILEFEKENEALEIDKKKQIAELESQLAKNQKFHEENGQKIELGRKAISDVKQNYANFSNVITESISLLKDKHKIENVKQFYAENKRKFVENVNSEKEISTFKMTTFSDLKVKTDLKNGNQSPQNWNPNKDFSTSRNRNNSKSKYNIYKIITFCFLFLWLGSMAYFFFDYKKKSTEKISTEKALDSINAENLAKNNLTFNLNPIPNDSLSKPDYKILAKKLSESLKLGEVAQIIFAQNPDAIKKYYQFQTEDYKKLLFQKNPNAFLISHIDTLFLGKDSLRIIPSRKIEVKIAK